MNKYIAGQMFQINGIYHHYQKNGKPHIYLTDQNDNILEYDANLFFPLKEGMVSVEYEKGTMTSYCYLEAKENMEVIEIKKTPYGTLKEVKNEFQCPNNIFILALEYYMCKGTKTWFFWKALVNSIALDLGTDYFLPTITCKQERIPNSGMIIYSNHKKEIPKHNKKGQIFL